MDGCPDGVRRAVISRKATIEFAIVGAVASALCCFTPIGRWLLNAFGLADWAASLQLVMLPLMSLFIGLGTGTAWFRSRERRRK